jgi:hypothetical protein
VAIIRTNRNRTETAAVVEDPTPGQNKIYFWQDGYDFNTLSPLFDQGLNHNVAGTDVSGFGRTRITNGAGAVDGYAAGVLFLDGDVTNVQANIVAVNSATANLDTAPFVSMDPTRQPRTVRHDTLNNNSMLYMNWNAIGQVTPRNISVARFNSRSLQDAPYRLTDNLGWCWHPVYFNQSTGNMVMVVSSYTTTHPSTYYGARIQSYISQVQAFTGVTAVTNRTGEFLGVDEAGRALFFLNSTLNDYDHLITRYIDVDNTATVLSTINSIPAAAGTSAGGNRGTAFGNQLPKYSSKTFPDPANVTNKAWYTPYFDVNGKYHPHFFQWDTVNDTFVRNTDITVNWPQGTIQEDFWTADTFSASSNSTSGFGLQRVWYNETWTVDSQRYLIFMQLHGATSIFDNTPKMRTFLTFSVNPSNPKILTYHSSVTIPSTAKNIIWLNDSKTLLGVIAHTQFYTYSFNPTNGWVLTGTIPFQFIGVGRDSLNRIWAASPGLNTWGEIHLITVNVPISITVTAPQNLFNYTGTVINSNLTVNAYDTTGSRIAASIKLVIDGGSMAFAGANLTTTVTTSTTQDTLVPIVITGGGLSNIIASVVL